MFNDLIKDLTDEAKHIKAMFIAHYAKGLLALSILVCLYSLAGWICS